MKELVLTAVRPTASTGPKKFFIPATIGKDKEPVVIGDNDDGSFYVPVKVIGEAGCYYNLRVRSATLRSKVEAAIGNTDLFIQGNCYAVTKNKEGRVTGTIGLNSK